MTKLTYRGCDIYPTEYVGAPADSRWTWAREEWDLGAPIGYAASVEEAKNMIDDWHDDHPACDFCSRPGKVYGGLHWDGWLCDVCETRRENGTSTDDLHYVPM
jgi:hypothetical protein